MKKTLIASAVALATFATAGVNAAEVNLPKVYGNIQLVLSQQDTETSFTDQAVKDSDYSHGDNGSTIGFSHDHEIMPGLTAFAKAEFEFTADEQKGGNNGLNTGDQAFLGVKGDFGTVKVGSYDTIVDDAIDDAVADIFEFYGTYELSPTNEGDTITYYSPVMNGLSVAAALQINGENDGSKFANDPEPQARNAVMAVVSYEMGDTKVAFAYDSAENSEPAKDVYGLSLSHAMGDIRLGAGYQTQDDIADIFSLSAVFAMGANQFIALYQFADFDKQTGRDSGSRVNLQALHNLSDNMYVYVEGQWLSEDADSNAKTTSTVAADSRNGDIESTGLAVGATYVF